MTMKSAASVQNRVRVDASKAYVDHVSGSEETLTVDVVETPR